MKTLVVGIGALGGLIAARLRAAGAPVGLATRDRESADRLRATGLRAMGLGGEARVEDLDVAPTETYRPADAFELIVLATKAREAVELAPRLAELLAPDGTLLPIQNGGVARSIADRLGDPRVLGGLSNLGATALAPGTFAQRNAGHLLIRELAGGQSPRAARVQAWLGQAVPVRVTPNLEGAVWSKLLVNCSVTTLGAVAGLTMRQYLGAPCGRALFEATYDEALRVARASGARLEPMLVEPAPPARPGPAYENWLTGVLAGYGDVKPSMLQDLEHGRPTEIDFINGHVVDRGRRLGVAVPVNAAIVETVHALSRGALVPSPHLLGQVLRAAGGATSA